MRVFFVYQAKQHSCTVINFYNKDKKNDKNSRKMKQKNKTTLGHVLKYKYSTYIAQGEHFLVQTRNIAVKLPFDFIQKK